MCPLTFRALLAGIVRPDGRPAARQPGAARRPGRPHAATRPAAGLRHARPTRARAATSPRTLRISPPPHPIAAPSDGQPR